MSLHLLMAQCFCFFNLASMLDDFFPSKCLSSFLSQTTVLSPLIFSSFLFLVFLSDIPILIPNVSLSIPKSPASCLASPRGGCSVLRQAASVGAKHPRRNVHILPALMGHLSHKQYCQFSSLVLHAAAGMFVKRNEQRAPDAVQPAATPLFPRQRGPTLDRPGFNPPRWKM